VLDALPFLHEATGVTIAEICLAGDEEAAEARIDDVARYLGDYLQGMHQLYLTDPAVKTTVPAPPPPADNRSQVQVQSGFRQHLCDGASEHGPAARAVSRNPDGACHRSGKGARVDH
jgi:hypothetical protein